MKRIEKAVLCLALCLCLLAAPCFAAAETPAFPDIAAHWARETMTRAVEDGYLNGFEDGTLRPNAVITRSQILQILARALALEPVSGPEALGLGGGEWYAAAALAAYDRGLISDASRLGEAVVRSDAMTLLCRALGLTDTETDPALLEPYMEDSAAQEVLSLVALGVVEGVGNSLKLDRTVSRAEFVTMLYRALDLPAAQERSLEGVSFSVSAKSQLRLNELLRASAVLTVPERALGAIVTARWYLGGALLEEQTLRLTEDGQRVAFCGGVPYSADLPDEAPVKLELVRWGREGAERVRGESEPVELENLSAAAWQELERERVLALVETGYDGDYTVEWAYQHDYSDADKTLWVNAKDFASETEYLIWVSIKYQRCNIFRGSRGAWTLVRSGVVGTGKIWSATPVGVWKTTFKQEEGWTTGSYTVVPVVRFKGGGFAFHSRLYAPGSDELIEPDVGYPMSHGCVRMLDEDIWWVFDNIPENTTVVVF